MKQNAETHVSVNSQIQYPNTERQEVGIIHRFSDDHLRHMGRLTLSKNILIKHMTVKKCQY